MADTSTNGTSNGASIPHQNGIAPTNNHMPDSPALNEAFKRVQNLVENALLSRQKFFDSFSDPRRNLDAECGYPPSADVNPDAYFALYRREPIAARVVELMPKESWQVTPMVYEDESSEKETDFEIAWDFVCNNLRGKSYYKDEDGSPLWEYMARADVLSRVGRFGVILLGINDGRLLQEPIWGQRIDGTQPINSPGPHTELPQGDSNQKDITGVSGLGTPQSLFGASSGHASGIGDVPNQTPANKSGQRGVNQPATTVVDYGNPQGGPVLPNDLDKGGAKSNGNGKPPNNGNKTTRKNIDARRLQKGLKGTKADGATPSSSYQNIGLNKPSNDRPGTKTGSESPLTKDIYGGVHPIAPLSSIMGTDAQYTGTQFSPSIGTATQLPYQGFAPRDTNNPTANPRSGQAPHDPNYPYGQSSQFPFLPSQQGSAVQQQKGKPQNNLLFIRIFPEHLVQVVQYEADLANPRFGQPVMYLITLNDPRQQHTGIGLPLATVRVHWTRVIHVNDTQNQADSSEIFSPPVMESVLNRLLDLQKLYGGSAEMYWKGAFPGISIETHPQLGGDVVVDMQGNKDMMESYFNGLQRYLGLIGMSAHTLSPTVSDPSGQIDTHIQAICIKLGCPKRIFMGSERGELASSQDDENWNDRVRHRQKFYITPRMIVPFIDRLIMLGVLPTPEDGYSIEWPPLDSLSASDKANIANTKTQAISAYIQANASTLIGPSDYLTKILGMDEEEVNAILEGSAQINQQAQDQQEQQQQEQQEQQQQMMQQQQDANEAIAQKHGYKPSPPPGYHDPQSVNPSGLPNAVQPQGPGGKPNPFAKGGSSGGTPPSTPPSSPPVPPPGPTQNIYLVHHDGEYELVDNAPGAPPVMGTNPKTGQPQEGNFVRDKETGKAKFFGKYQKKEGTAQEGSATATAKGAMKKLHELGGKPPNAIPSDQNQSQDPAARMSHAVIAIVQLRQQREGAEEEEDNKVKSERSRGKKPAKRTTTANATLVANAISSHHHNSWYIDLLSAALDRDDVPTVNEAILLANRAYEETPTSPVVNLDDDSEGGDSGGDKAEGGNEDDGGESGQADEVENELTIAINEASQTKFVYNDNEEGGEDEDGDEEVENEDEDGGISQDYGEDEEMED